jgi:hypothetical protein
MFNDFINHNKHQRSKITNTISTSVLNTLLLSIPANSRLLLHSTLSTMYLPVLFTYQQAIPPLTTAESQSLPSVNDHRIVFLCRRYWKQFVNNGYSYPTEKQQMCLQKHISVQQCVHHVVSRLRQWVGYTFQVSTEAVRYNLVLQHSHYFSAMLKYRLSESTCEPAGRSI